MNNTAKTILILLIFFISTLAIGCGVIHSPSPAGYFPHQNGLKWVYREQFTGTLPSTGESTFRIDGGTTLSNGIVVQNMIASREWESGVRDLESTLYYYVGENGIYKYGTSHSPTNEGTEVIPLPLEVGQSWIRGNYRCTATTAETITVPAGTFNTIKVEIGNSDYCEWYADGVGLVKYSLTNIATTTISPTGRIISDSCDYIVELKSKNF